MNALVGSDADVFDAIVAGMDEFPRCTVRRLPGNERSRADIATYSERGAACGQPAEWVITARCCSGSGLACSSCLARYVAHFNSYRRVGHVRCGRRWPEGTRFATAWKAVRL